MAWETNPTRIMSVLQVFPVKFLFRRYHHHHFYLKVEAAQKTLRIYFLKCTCTTTKPLTLSPKKHKIGRQNFSVYCLFYHCSCCHSPLKIPYICISWIGSAIRLNLNNRWYPPTLTLPSDKIRFFGHPALSSHWQTLKTSYDLLIVVCIE